MALFGMDDARALTQNLDAARLARLTADLLWVSGHQSIRIVDGPGDGGRDVHAMAPDGERILAQCKFHSDVNKTCGTKEVAELPMALTKMGYRRGVFVTNSGISPQAKREYLDNYPNLELAFLDGDQLARTVLQHPLLKSLWFDGKTLERVAASLALPVIVREHSLDQPIVPSRCDPPMDPTPLLESLCARFKDLYFRFQESTPGSQQFEPYRFPEPFTLEEGVLPFLRASEVLVDGDVSLPRIPEITRAVAEAFTDFLIRTWPRTTIRVGRPFFTALSGTSRGARIEVSDQAQSFVTTKSVTCALEPDFMSLAGSGWTATSDARMSEGGFIRIYQPALDCCAAYEVIGRPSAAMYTLNRARNEWFAAGWGKSVFASVPSFKEWPYDDIPNPEHHWPADGRSICAWFDGALVSGIFVPRSLGGATDPFSEMVPDLTEALVNVKTCLQDAPNIDLLSPETARHMIALAAGDPFHEGERFTHRTAEVSHFPEALPSPVLPVSRKFEVLTAWEILERSERLSEALNGVSIEGPRGACAAFQVDGAYVVGTWTLPPDALVDMATADVLRSASKDLEDWLPQAESWLTQRGGKVQRATQEYWKRAHNVHLGVDAVSSDKAYLWTLGPDGEWLPQWTGNAFESGSTERGLPEGMTEAMDKALRNRGTNKEGDRG